MCRDLSPTVAKIITHASHYLKKKAILSATRIIRKVPESVDEFAEKIEKVILSDSQNHGMFFV